MSEGNSSRDGNGSGGGEEEGWASKFLKVAGAVAATAAVAGGLLAVLASSVPANTEPEVPFGARRVQKEPEDPWSSHREIPTQIGWTKPEIGWVKLNVDGSRVHEGRPSAGCGGVLRDSSGTWLQGFAEKLDPTYEVHETEMRGILKGLELAWDHNDVKKLSVESDRKSAVDLVNHGCKPSHPQFHIVDCIRQLIRDPKWQVTLTLIHRKANRVANRLANDAHDLPLGLHRFSDPPPKCTTLLLEDARGVSF